MEIEWRDISIEGYGDYQVSNDGQIRNKKSKHAYACSSIRQGYKSTVLINKEKQKKTYKVHRLVALSFIPNDDPKKDAVNHKDGNKFNNKVDNLEWVSIAENNQHAQDTGLTPKTCRPVYQCNKDTGEIIKRYETLMGAGKDTSIDPAGIAKCCKGTRCSAGGYKWKFVEANDNEKKIDLCDFIVMKDLDRYMINREGLIYSIHFKKLMKQQTNNDGSLTVSLGNGVDKRAKSFLVHRLIAINFIENDDPENKNRVIHINKKKTDNRINNLKWVK
jgi:hypothetical protein